MEQTAELALLARGVHPKAPARRLVTDALVNRVAALIAFALVVAAQWLAPAGSDSAPTHLIMRFLAFPAGWSLPLFALIVCEGADRLRLAKVLMAIGALGALSSLSPQIEAVLLESMPEAGPLRLALSAIAIASYGFVAARIALGAPAERSRWIDILCVGSLIHVSALGIPFFRDNTVAVSPGILDLKLARIDESFGFQASAAMAMLLDRLPTLKTLAQGAYITAQPAIVIVAAFDWRRREAPRASVIPAFMIASAIGFVCYYLAPAMGPIEYFMADFPVLHVTPAQLSHMPLYDFDRHHPRNAFPSLHMTWAILVFLYTRGFSIRGRVAAFVFTALTFCATLGLGEHYLIDLLVALTLALTVRSIYALELPWTQPDRVRGMIAGFGMLGLWIGLIGFGPIVSGPPVLALAIATSFASVSLERALARAEARSRPDPTGATARAIVDRSGLGSVESGFGGP